MKQKQKPEKVYIRYLFYFLFLLTIAITAWYLYLYDSGQTDINTANAITSMSISFFFSALVFAYLMLRGMNLSSIIDYLNLSRAKLNKNSIYTGIAVFFIILLFELLLAVFSKITNIPLPTNVDQLFQGLPTYFYVFVAFIGPINEEIFFRGFLIKLFDGFLSKFKPDPKNIITRWFGIVVSAALFAILHAGYASIAELLGAFAFGLLAGYIFKRTNSLYSTIIPHVGVNLLTILALLYAPGM